MENFLNPFIGKGVFFSLENIINKDSSEFSYVKCLQSLILKQDVIFELKQILSSACASKPFTVKNDLTKKMIVHLNLLILSDEDTKAKADVFRNVFKTFVSDCKDDNVHIMQFFMILSHLLGMNLVPNVNESNETDDGAINFEEFNSAFGVNTSDPSPATFSIFKDLLLCLSKLSLNFNSLEIQCYRKWLHRLIKNLAYFKPFQNEFLEIFSVCAEIDLKLLEGNLDHIFCNVLALNAPLDDEFCNLYGTFLEKALDICSKFQKTIKFIAKFFSSFRVTPIHLVKEIILPPNVINKFSQIVAVASNQQSLSLLDFLLHNLDECFVDISQGSSGSNPLLLLVTSQLLISLFKDVKLYAPNISSKTLAAFIDKLNAFKESLHKFGAYVFNNTQFISKNRDVVKSFLDLCIYCGEIKMLVDCYKDSLIHPSDTKMGEIEYEWHCCLDLQQWESLIRIVLKSKLEALSPSCFRLALQKCRESKLKNEIPHTDESTLKIIFSQLTSDMKNFNIFQQLPPEDLTIVMDMLSVKQSKSICQRILKRLLENDSKEEWMAWLSSPVLQENALFVFNIFSLILEETGCVLRDLIPDKSHLEVSWLSDKYFKDHSILPGSLEGLPEKINCLLKNSKKVRKFFGKNHQQKEGIMRVIEVFKALPLPLMKGDCRKLGLCFALSMGVLLTDDENSVCLPFESMCSFLISDVDASTCFDIGLCVGWLSGIAYEDEKVNDIRMKLIEIIIRNSPKTEFGLIQLGVMIDSTETPKRANLLKMLESRVVLHNEFNKCRQRAKKRKSDNDLIVSYRNKLAKIISEEARQLKDNTINPDNSKILLQILAIELNNSIKTNEEKEIAALMDQKFLSHFDFAVKNLKRNFDEPSASFLSVVLQCMPRIGKFLPEGSIFKIWKALKFHEKMNWRLFYKQSSEEEFSAIVDDLLEMSKKFLKSESEKHSSNCLEIWVFFFEMSSDTKRQYCLFRLQDFFHYVHNCDLRLRKLSIRKKLLVLKFASFCVSKKEVTLTSHMLDTIIHVMIECLDDTSSVDDFCNLFAVEVETASGVVLRQFDWSKSKIHLAFVLFKKLLASLMRRCDAGLQPSKDDVIQLSTCAFGLEKWVSLLVKRERDFARTTPYFITILISSVASVTVLPAIKVHLVNCINYFLSISDSHTVSYLMRVLKPGFQQVFNTMYNQFKKYHKYTGKI